MKSYTDIEQSKKLTEILPIESADIFWYRDAVTKENNPRIMSLSQVPKNKSMYYSPCWSLTTLFSVLPEGTRLLKSATDAIYHCDCPKGNIDKWFDNPIDACYEMILKLNELKML